MVQGKLVNGSIGHVIGSKTPHEARACGIDVAKTEDQARPRDTSQESRYCALTEAAEHDSWPEVKFQKGLSLLCVLQACTSRA